jgi:hypothetical protein
MIDERSGAYVTRDGQFEYHRVRVPALVIRFHAPLDVILRDLDANYIASAWRSAQDVLAGHAIEPDRFSWGVGQFSELRAFGHSHTSRPILETLGWVAAEQEMGEFEPIPPYPSRLRPPWEAITAELEASIPPLCVGYDHYEAQTITLRNRRPISNGDGQTALEVMRVDCTDSPVEWVFFDPSERLFPIDVPTDAPDAPWMRLGHAMYERDEAALVTAMDAVRSEYSEHGALLCLESAARWLMMRPNGPDR